MKPKWQKLASLAQEKCTLWFQLFGAVFASKGYPPYKNILDLCVMMLYPFVKFERNYLIPSRVID